MSHRVAPVRLRGRRADAVGDVRGRNVSWANHDLPAAGDGASVSQLTDNPSCSLSFSQKCTTSSGWSALSIMIWDTSIWGRECLNRLKICRPKSVTLCSRYDVDRSRFPDRSPEHFVFPACANAKIDPERPLKTGVLLGGGLAARPISRDYASTIYRTRQPLSYWNKGLRLPSWPSWSASTAIPRVKRYEHIRPEVQR